MSKIDKPIVPNPRDSQYDKKPLQTGLNGLDFMSKRLNNHGGFAQQKRMINDKNIPPISIGWYYNNKCNNIKHAINIAEEEMRREKRIFYKHHSCFER